MVKPPKPAGLAMSGIWIDTPDGRRRVGLRSICGETCAHPMSAATRDALARAWLDHSEWMGSMKRQGIEAGR